MSTSYSIYRFAKPTKHELSGIDYFSEYDSFGLHDSDLEQTVGCIRLFRSADKEIANIINSKFVHPLVLPEKVTDYEKLYRELGFDKLFFSPLANGTAVSTGGHIYVLFKKFSKITQIINTTGVGNGLDL